jgi:hypothetical protein
MAAETKTVTKGYFSCSGSPFACAAGWRADEAFAEAVRPGRRFPDLIDDERLLENSDVVPDEGPADMPATVRPAAAVDRPSQSLFPKGERGASAPCLREPSPSFAGQGADAPRSPRR